MTLSERKKAILRAVIEHYVMTVEPVGSKAISGEIGVTASPATIRSEMAELEAMGLLEQPHTSAGRIPSALGYRVYVNEIMQSYKLTRDDTSQIDVELKARRAELDEALEKVGRLTSRLTSYPAFALSAFTSEVTVKRFDFLHVDNNTFIAVLLLSNDSVKNKLVHLPVVVSADMLSRLATMFNAGFTGIGEEKISQSLISATERAFCDEIGIVRSIAAITLEFLYNAKSVTSHITGESKIFEHPEYRDIGKAQGLIRYLSDDKELVRLPSPDANSDLKITIGPENLAAELKDSSVVVARYDVGQDVQGLIGVVGPTRMDYSKVTARLSYIARALGWLFSGDEHMSSETPEALEKINNDKTGDDDID